MTKNAHPNSSHTDHYDVRTVLGDVHVQACGQGPAMVCWSSLLMNSVMWGGQVEHFSNSHRMILIDPPGHGRSAALSRNFTMEECALCLTQVLDALEIEDCVLVGNSWGGMMGGVFAALYPRRARATVLMNCTGARAGLKQRLEFFALSALLRHLNSVPDLLINRAVAAFAGPTTERTKPEVIDFIRSTVATVNSKSVSWAIESVVPRRADHHQLLGAIDCPTLVIAGQEDRTFPVAETEKMAQAIPGAQFKVLDAVGHLAALEAPERVNQEIEAFLSLI